LSLSEEIFSPEEGTIATRHKKIFIAKLPNVDEQKLKTNLEKLKKSLDNPKEIIKALQQVVPEYTPSS